MNESDIYQQRMNCLVEYIKNKAKADHQWRMLIKFAKVDDRIMDMLVRATANLQPQKQSFVYGKAKHLPDLRARVMSFTVSENSLF